MNRNGRLEGVTNIVSAMVSQDLGIDMWTGWGSYSRSYELLADHHVEDAARKTSASPCERILVMRRDFRVVDEARWLSLG